MINPIPHEFAFAGVYTTPWLVMALLGFAAALISTHLLNRYKLSKYFAHPPVVFMALIVIYTISFGRFFIKG